MHWKSSGCQSASTTVQVIQQLAPREAVMVADLAHQDGF